MRIVPVVGTPITAGDLKKMLSNLAGNGDPVERFEMEFAGYIGARFAVSTPSARSALYWVLKTLREQSQRTEVIIPAYVHRSVLYAVVASGLTPVLCDAAPHSFQMDVELLPHLVTERTLCILPTYLFGFPLDIEKVCKIARGAGCFIVEDGAQACGATWRGEKLGRFGDAAIFSFKKSKPFTTVTGGMLVTSRPDLISRCEELKRAREPRRSDEIKMFMQILLLALAVRPWIFGPLFRLGLPLVERDGRVDLPVRRMGKVQAALGLVMLGNLERMNEIRARNGQVLAEQLSGNGHYVLPRVMNGSRSIFLRYPILVKDGALRETLAQRLLKTGIWASATDYGPLNEIRDFTVTSGIKNGSEIFRNARRTTDCILTLPTHSGVNPRDLARLLAILKTPATFGASE